MKLVACLEIGVETGMKTVKRCVEMIDLHCMNIFSYDKINDELRELFTEYKKGLDEGIFTENSKSEEVLKLLKGVS